VTPSHIVPPCRRGSPFLQALVLNFLAEDPRHLTPEELARELAVDLEVMRRLCQKLEEAGYISRAG